MTSEESENTEQIAFAPFYNTKLKDSAAPLYLDAAATPPPAAVARMRAAMKSR